MSQYNIAVIVGSLRKDSFNRKLATALARLAPADFRFTQVRLDDLPLYNQDDDGQQAASVLRLKGEIKAAQGLLFVTPEYNRSIPGALKNALDVGSRPYGHSIWQGKPAAIVSVSPGALAAFGANHHLRQPLVFLGMPTMQQPEAYIGNVADLLDENGKLKKDDTRKFLKAFTDAFADWIDKTRG